MKFRRFNEVIKKNININKIKIINVELTKYLILFCRLGGVSRPEYLFSALFSDTPWNNTQLGSTWTVQSGYPIVVATESNSTLSLRQIKVIYK